MVSLRITIFSLRLFLFVTDYILNLVAEKRACIELVFLTANFMRDFAKVFENVEVVKYRVVIVL